MKTSRKSIREAIRDHIKQVLPTIPIYTRRYVDATGLEDLVTVYFQTGEIQSEGIQFYTSAILSISIYGNLHCEDNQLDDYGEMIESQLENDRDLEGLVRGLQFQGFEYPMDDDPHFNQLILNYTIQY